MSFLKRSPYAFYDVMVTKKVKVERSLADLIQDCNVAIPNAMPDQLLAMKTGLDEASFHMNNAAKVMK